MENVVDIICVQCHSLPVPTDVVATDEFVEWYDDLDDRSRKSVMRAVDLLEQTAKALRHPHSSQIKGSRYSCVSCASKVAGIRYASSTSSMQFAEAIWEQYQAEREQEKKP